MKKGAKATPQLYAGNLKLLVQLLGDPGTLDATVGLLFLIADMLDTVAKNSNMYMIIGKTSNGSAFSVTIKGDDAPPAFYGQTLAELGVQALDLL